MGITRISDWACALCAATLLLSAAATGQQTPPPAQVENVPEITVEAPEPRFVAPTRRDKIGRIWAPVYINDRGPFRLVLDSGASHSAVTMQVVQELGLPLDRTPPIMLRGVTGSAQVPAIRVYSMSVGDLMVNSTVLPVIADALGGAQGILGTDGLQDRRLFIDFRHDEIRITRSKKERAAAGFLTLPFKLVNDQLLAIDARIGVVRVLAIIDTGGQVTIGNNALRDALFRASKKKRTQEQVTGVTLDVQSAENVPTPPIELGPLQLRGATILFGDMQIFTHWNLERRPAILIGMNAIGLFDTLIIDYRRRELQIRMPSTLRSSAGPRG